MRFALENVSFFRSSPKKKLRDFQRKTNASAEQECDHIAPAFV